jgi:predicted site-specific integrase-resolvase
MKIAEAAKTLGISMSSFYRYVKSGKIQVSRHPLRGVMFISKKELSRIKKLLKK